MSMFAIILAGFAAFGAAVLVARFAAGSGQRGRNSCEDWAYCEGFAGYRYSDENYDAH